MTAGLFTRLTREQAERMRAIAAQLGTFALPLVNALADGRITLVIPRRTDRAPLDAMRRATRPVLVLIGDDDYVSTGPDGWRCAQKVTRWARAGLVDGAGGERRDYEAAVVGAETHKRFVLIETASCHIPAWLALLTSKPVLVIVPKGGPHPVAEMREAVH